MAAPSLPPTRLRRRFLMNNALISVRRIHKDFSPSVSKLWNQFRPGSNQKDSGEATLHRVTCLKGMKVLQVAAGVEHSALVTVTSFGGVILTRGPKLYNFDEWRGHNTRLFKDMPAFTFACALIKMTMSWRYLKLFVITLKFLSNTLAVLWKLTIMIEYSLPAFPNLVEVELHVGTCGA